MTEVKTAGLNAVEILKYCKRRLTEIRPMNAPDSAATTKYYSSDLASVVIGVAADMENPAAGINSFPAIRIFPTGGDWQRQQCWHERTMLFEFDLFSQGADGEEALYNNLALQDDVKAWLERHQRFNADAVNDGWAMQSRIVSDVMARQVDKGIAVTYLSSLLVEIRFREDKYKGTTN